MISAVLDSNIFISALLFNGNQRIIINHAIEGDFKINISHEIISEIDFVLKRPKFKLTLNQITLFLNEINSLTEMCYPSVKIINSCRDSKDHIILECAIESKSDYIVTGDNDLLVLKNFKTVSIVNSDTFLSIIGDKTVCT
jgi:uncharacterized protein